MPSDTRDTNEASVNYEIEDNLISNKENLSPLTNSIKFHESLESYKEGLVKNINALDEKLQNIDSDIKTSTDEKEVRQLEERKKSLVSDQSNLRQKGMKSLLYPEKFELKDGQISVADKKALDDSVSKLKGDEKIPLNDTQNKMSVLADKDRRYALPKPTPEGVVVLGGTTLINEETKDIYVFESQKIRNSDDEPLVWLKARKVQDGYAVSEDEDVFKELGINPETLQHGMPGVLEQAEYEKLKSKYDVDVEKLRKEHTKNEVNALNQIKASNLKESINRAQIKQKRQLVTQDAKAGIVLASETLEAKTPQEVLDNATFDQKFEVRKMDDNEVEQMAVFSGLKARQEEEQKLNEEQNKQHKKNAEGNPDLARTDTQEGYEIASYKPDGSLGKVVSTNGFMQSGLNPISAIDYGPAAASIGAGMAQVIDIGGNDAVVAASRAQADAKLSMTLKQSANKKADSSDDKSYEKALIKKTMRDHKISGDPNDPKLTGNFGNPAKKAPALKKYEEMSQSSQPSTPKVEEYKSLDKKTTLKTKRPSM